MPTLYGIIILGSAIILQTTIASRITLLQGPVDLVMLTFLAWVLREGNPGLWRWGVIAGLAVGFASELPIWLMVSAYLLIAALVQVMKQRIWQAPVISLFVTTLIGTLLIQGISLLYLLINGSKIELPLALNLVILPSMILNLLITFPTYALVGEISARIYPDERDR